MGQRSYLIENVGVMDAKLAAQNSMFMDVMLETQMWNRLNDIDPHK